MYSFMHPTTVVLVDDNVNFVKSIMALLRNKDIVFSPYDNPNSAIDFLQKQAQEFRGRDFFINQYPEGVNFSTLGKVYDCLRFSEVSVVVSDYEMPIVTGVELFKKIRKIDCYKIMLTGIATNALATSMLRDRLIDNFIRKNDYDFSNILIDVLLNGKDELFKNFDCKKTAIAKSLKLQITLDKHLENFLDGYINNLDIVEYYLLDENGSYLLINGHSNISAIFVYNRDSLLKNYELLREYFDSIDLKAIIEGEKIITIPIHMLHEHISDVKYFLFDAKQSENSVKYFFVEDASYLVNKKEILFFNDFRNKNASPKKDISNLYLYS